VDYLCTHEHNSRLGPGSGKAKLLPPLAVSATTLGTLLKRIKAAGVSQCVGGKGLNEEGEEGGKALRNSLTTPFIGKYNGRERNGQENAEVQRSGSKFALALAAFGFAPSPCICLPLPPSLIPELRAARRCSGAKGGAGGLPLRIAEDCGEPPSCSCPIRVPNSSSRALQQTNPLGTASPLGRLAAWAACALSHGRQPGNPARPAL
jgi:hypothetical protein